MNLSQIDLLAASAAALAVLMCGITNLKTLIRVFALQTSLFAVLCLLSGGERSFGLAAVVFLVKAVGIPVFLSWAAGKMSMNRDKGVNLNPTLAMIAGFIVLIAGYCLAPYFAVVSSGNPASSGMSVALLLTGMLIMITRRLAISQVVGFLIMENGIFLYGLTQTRRMPHLIEMAAVFEALIAVLIAGLVILRINQSFEHIDVSRMRGLRH